MTVQVLPTNEGQGVGLIKQMFDKREDKFTLDNVQESQPVLVSNRPTFRSSACKSDKIVLLPGACFQSC